MYIKNKLQISALALALIAPLSASAVVIDAEDSIAGLPVSVSVADVSAGSQLDLIIEPPFGAAYVFPFSGNETGTVSIELTGPETQIAGSYDYFVEKNGIVISPLQQFTVLPDTVDLDHSTLQVDRNAISPTGSDEAIVTAILRDQFDNALPGRPVTLISSRSVDRVTPVTSETDESGKQVFTVSTTQQGSINLRALDVLSGKLLKSEQEISAGGSYAVGGVNGVAQAGYPQGYYPAYYPPYNPYGASLYNPYAAQVTTFGPVHHLELIVPDSLEINEDASITLIARDQSGNKVEDYTGTVTLTSSDSTAYLPLGGSVTFTPQNLGEKILTLGLRFRQPGTHTLTAQDQNDPTIRAETSIMVTGQGDTPTTRSIIITSHKDGEEVIGSPITLTGTALPFINFTVTGGENEVKGETDAQGRFSVEVPIDIFADELILKVREDLGRYESSALRLKVGNLAPRITSLTITPQQPEEEQSVTVQIQTEPGLTFVQANVEDQTVSMSEVSEGTYEVLLNPLTVGIKDIEVVAANAYGIQTTIAANFTVIPKTIPVVPTVQNVVATPSISEIGLTWDPITDLAVEKYRVYVGTDPNNFEFSLDTQGTVPQATIGGLRSGTVYYFAVTALFEEYESQQKSAVISASVLGLALDVIPGDGVLILDWSNMQIDRDLSSFVIEYGVEPDSYTEMRQINGQLKVYTIYDLINDVKYFVRITPVDTAGKALTELSETGEGIPFSENPGFSPVYISDDPFHQSAPPILPDPNPQTQPRQDLLNDTPVNTLSGIPLPLWSIPVVLFVALLLFVRHLSSRRKETAFLDEVNKRYTDHT